MNFNHNSNFCSIVWFRADLRISDNPALSAAVKSDRPCIALFVLPTDKNEKSELKKWELPSARPTYGSAGRWWLLRSLERLRQELAALKIPLLILEGVESEVIKNFREVFPSAFFYWNRRYDPVGVAFDTKLKQELKENDRLGGSFKGNLLNEPWEITNGSGEAYKVFTPFWKAVQKRPMSAMAAIAAPKSNNTEPQNQVFDHFVKPNSSEMSGLKFYKSSAAEKAWTSKIHKHWSSFEMLPQKFLEVFLREKLTVYREGRNTPSLGSTSSLSPFLRFGEISPRQILAKVFAFEKVSTFSELSENAYCFLSEICWRDFSYSILFNYKSIDTMPIKSNFSDFPWEQNENHFLLWKQGNTGYPIVDAGMRELWQTGLMHNRVRMIVASFLVKHLRLPWTWGESWFWDTLVDACPASNPASWQWVTGCGLDAAPYFRIFNPISQGQKFDPAGTYVKKWVPELSLLSAKQVHTPWLADEVDLRRAKIKMGLDYPFPVVDHASARVKALSGFQKIRGNDVSSSAHETDV